MLPRAKPRGDAVVDTPPAARGLRRVAGAEGEAAEVAVAEGAEGAEEGAVVAALVIASGATHAGTSRAIALSKETAGEGVAGVAVARTEVGAEAGAEAGAGAGSGSGATRRRRTQSPRFSPRMAATRSLTRSR